MPKLSAIAMPTIFLRAVFLLLAVSNGVALRLQPAPARAAAAMVAESPASATAAAAVLPAERYVATNRFRVKAGREAAFEKRWADRKSRLGLLNGFRFFCMMRRVDGFDDAKPYADDVNYISCTVWEQVCALRYQ